MKNHSLRFKLPLFLVLTLFVTFGVQAAKAEPAADLKSLAEKSIEVINTGNMELAAEVYSTDIKLHLVHQIRPLVAGLEALNQYGDFLRTAYPDMKFAVTDFHEKRIEELF